MKLIRNKRSGIVYELRNVATYSITMTLPGSPQEIYDNTSKLETEYEIYEFEVMDVEHKD